MSTAWCLAVVWPMASGKLDRPTLARLKSQTGPMY